MPSINIIHKDGRRTKFTIQKDEISIGRSKDNDIVLADNTISRHHSMITKTSQGYLLADLGSFNGIQLNSKPISTAILKHDDLFRIGLSKLTFLMHEKAEDSLTLLSDTDEARGSQTIIRSSPHVANHGTGELLLTPELQKDVIEEELTPHLEKTKVTQDEEHELTALERSNKVLFVLYEISRQLISITDFHELLKKIMDLIFMVIEADYGYLILTGEDVGEELIPVVVKCRDDNTEGKTSLSASRSIVKRVIKDKVALLTSDAMSDTRLNLSESVFLQKTKSAMCVPLWEKEKIIGAIQLDSIQKGNQFDEDDLELLKTIGVQMSMVIEQANLNAQVKDEERMRNRLERFHSPQLIDMILKGEQETKDSIMEPKDITATILFLDIIGFTRLAEQMPPRDVNMLLNQYFTRMTDIIFEYDGMIDKYIGDAIMAVFGAPMEKKGDPERAIQAALKMREDLELMKKDIDSEKQFNIRIGINTGRVVAGNIGSPRRMDYTVIGDSVNIASRLESNAKPNQILIGKETYKHVKKKFLINKIGSMQVKGKSQEIIAYEVIK